ncbi:MAG: adenylate/guanylate cyclase domain-containing protein [Alphaproteobacteria bacterium]
MSETTRRRLAAIVSADVVGYSRLMGVDEVGTHARLKANYSDLVEPKIAAHEGRVVKLMGDGLLAEFPSVVNAVDWTWICKRESPAAMTIYHVINGSNTGSESTWAISSSTATISSATGSI